MNDTFSSSGTDLATAGDSALITGQGKTTIADTVVAKIAGLAAREVYGVNAVGAGASRALAGLRDKLPVGSALPSQGVSVEVGEKQAAVDLTLVVEYGVAIHDVAASVRENIISQVEQMTGLQVTEVNIDVADVHLPDQDGDDAPNDQPARVQ